MTPLRPTTNQVGITNCLASGHTGNGGRVGARSAVLSLARRHAAAPTQPQHAQQQRQQTPVGSTQPQSQPSHRVWASAWRTMRQSSQQTAAMKRKALSRCSRAPWSLDCWPPRRRVASHSARLQQKWASQTCTARSCSTTRYGSVCVALVRGGAHTIWSNAMTLHARKTGHTNLSSPSLLPLSLPYSIPHSSSSSSTTCYCDSPPQQPPHTAATTAAQHGSRPSVSSASTE